MNVQSTVHLAPIQVVRTCQGIKITF